MKKIIFLFLSLSLLITLVGCKSGGKKINDNDTDESSIVYDVDKILNTNGTFRYVVNEKGANILDLPNSPSNIRIYINDDCLNHLSKIDNDLFLAAGRKIFDSVKDNSIPALSIYRDSENYLYLYGEIIVHIDPPNTEIYEGEVYSEGCGLDHDHLCFRERISLEPISQ